MYGRQIGANAPVFAKADLIIGPVTPTEIRRVRAASGDHPVRFLMELQPQYTETWNDVWLPDVVWSIRRAMQKACHEEDWYLYDTSGRPIQWQTGAVLNRFVNWTKHCPVGKYGDRVGLRAAEWYALTLARMAVAYRWNRFNTFNGIMFEILVDCLGSLGTNEMLRYADPNRDGQPEGVTKTCGSGGKLEPLSDLMREENDLFFATLFTRLPVDVGFWINDNNDETGPDERVKAQGVKLENILRGYPAGRSWESWFYGGDPSYIGSDAQKEGRGSDILPFGTEASIWYHRRDPGWDRDRQRKEFLFHACSAALGDGYFCITTNEKDPILEPEMLWDLGEPVSRYIKMPMGGGALYSREYEQARVFVNRTGYTVGPMDWDEETDQIGGVGWIQREGD